MHPAIAQFLAKKIAENLIYPKPCIQDMQQKMEKMKN